MRAEKEKRRGIKNQGKVIFGEYHDTHLYAPAETQLHDTDNLRSLKRKEKKRKSAVYRKTPTGNFASLGCMHDQVT